MGHSRNESVKRAESTTTNILKIKVLHFALDFKLETHTLSYANRTHCTPNTLYVCIFRVWNQYSHRMVSNGNRYFGY